MDRIFESETIKEEEEDDDDESNDNSKSDCLIVVGTELTTGLASTIVNKFITEKKTIIEINLN